MDRIMNDIDDNMSIDFPADIIESDFGNPEDNNIFVDENDENVEQTNNIPDNFYYGYNRDKTRLGNESTMGEHTLSTILGQGERGNRIAQTFKAVNERADPGSQTATRAAERNRSFKNSLRREAAKKQVWVDDIHSDESVLAGELLSDKGSESLVYISKDGKSVIKTKSLDFYTNPEDIVYALASHNSEFVNDQYEVLGFTENDRGETSIIVRQPLVYPMKDADGNVVEVTQEQLDDQLSGMGYHKVTPDGNMYTNGEFILNDLGVNNVVMDMNGHIRFIDPWILPARTINDRNFDRSKENTTFAPMIVNEKGEIDYDELERRRVSFERGSKLYDGFMVRILQGTLAAGSRAVEASLILRGDVQADAYDIFSGGSIRERRGRTLTQEEIDDEVYRQEELLERYAKDNGIWYDPKVIAKKRIFSSGSEANVYKDGDGQVMKVYYDYRLNQANPIEFLENISLFNSVFPDAKYELLGFTNTENGEFAPVLRQQFIDGQQLGMVDDTFFAKVDEYFTSRGFKRNVNTGAYYNDDVVIYDLHPGNIVFAKNGTPFVIDANVKPNIEQASNDISSLFDVSERDIEESKRKCR
jgi:hypothetical protein